MKRKWVYFVLIPLLLAAAVLVPTWILVERTVSGPNFKARLEEAASDYLHRPLTIEQIDWQPWPAWVLVGKDVKLWEDASKEHVMIQAPAVEAHITLLSVYKAVISISDLKIMSPHYTVRRNAKGEINLVRLINEILDQPEKKERTWGKVLFTQLTIKGARFSENNVDVATDGNIKFATGKSTFTGLIKSTSAEAEFALALTPSPRWEAVIDLPFVRFRSATADNVHAVVHKTNDNYALEKTQFECLGGTIVLQGLYRPAASTDSLKIEWETTNVEIHDLFKFAGSDADGSGRLDSNGKLTTAPGDIARNLNGTVSVQLKNGWFGNAKGLLKVITKLNLTTLFTEVKGAHVSRVPFDDTHGTVNIVNGVAATTEPFVLKNKTMEMAFMGSFDLPQKTVDGKIVVNVLLVTDEIIHKIPLLRDILLGDEKGLVPIWLSVTGDAGDPKIKVLSVKSIAAPVWNTIANTLKIPSKLFDKITGK